MSIGEKIKNARLKKEYTQEQVAEQLLVSRQTISNWETDKSLPDIVSIVKMSDLYQISLDELMKGDNVLMNKLEKDVRVAQAEKKLFKFGWISVLLGAIVLILGQLFEGNPFVDFISGALPWILLGLMLLFAMLYLDQESKTDK